MAFSRVMVCVMRVRMSFTAEAKVAFEKSILILTFGSIVVALLRLIWVGMRKDLEDIMFLKEVYYDFVHV